MLALPSYGQRQELSEPAELLVISRKFPQYDEHMEFMRDHGEELLRRLDEPRRFLQVLVGPRQVGKSTLIGLRVRTSPH